MLTLLKKDFGNILVTPHFDSFFDRVILRRILSLKKNE